MPEPADQKEAEAAGCQTGMLLRTRVALVAPLGRSAFSLGGVSYTATRFGHDCGQPPGCGLRAYTPRLSLYCYRVVGDDGSDRTVEFVGASAAATRLESPDAGRPVA